MVSHLKQFLLPLLTHVLLEHILAPFLHEDGELLRSASLSSVPIANLLRDAEPCAERPSPCSTLAQEAACHAKRRL